MCRGRNELLLLVLMRSILILNYKVISISFSCFHLEILLIQIDELSSPSTIGLARRSVTGLSLSDCRVVLLAKGVICHLPGYIYDTSGVRRSLRSWCQPAL